MRHLLLVSFLLIETSGHCCLCLLSNECGPKTLYQKCKKIMGMMFKVLARMNLKVVLEIKWFLDHIRGRLQKKRRGKLPFEYFG